MCAPKRERVRWDEMLTMYVCRLLCMYVYMMHVFRYLGMYVSMVVYDVYTICNCLSWFTGLSQRHSTMSWDIFTLSGYIYYIYLFVLCSRVWHNDRVQRHSYIYTLSWRGFTGTHCRDTYMTHNHLFGSRVCPSDFAQRYSYIYMFFLIHILHIYVYLGSLVCPNDLVERHSYTYTFM